VEVAGLRVVGGKLGCWCSGCLAVTGTARNDDGGCEALGDAER
jgi:hypothetical protein